MIDGNAMEGKSCQEKSLLLQDLFDCDDWVSSYQFYYLFDSILFPLTSLNFKPHSKGPEQWGGGENINECYKSLFFKFPVSAQYQLFNLIFAVIKIL